MKFVKFTLLCCLLLIFSTSSFCQKITSSLSEKIETRFSSDNTVRIGSNYIGYAMQDRFGTRKNYDGTRKNNDDCWMEIMEFDDQYKELRSVKQKNGERAYYSWLSKIIRVNNKAWLIYRDAAPKNTVTNVLAAEIDPVTLSLGAPKTVADIGSMDPKLGSGKTMQVEYSPDGKSILLDLENGGTHFLSALDENMNVVWSKFEGFPEYKQIRLSAIKIDNERNVYIGYGSSKKADLSAQMDIGMRVYTHDQKQKEITIDPGSEDLELAVVDLIHSGKNSILVTGGYRNKSNKDKLEGLFSGEISGKNNFQAPVFTKQAFTAASVEHADKMGWGSVKEKKYGIDLPAAVITVLMEDGSIDFVGAYAEDVTTVSERTWWTKYLGIVNFRLTDKSAIASYIPWKSLKKEGLQASVTAYPYKDKMIIFYTDDPKFLKKSMDNRHYSGDDYPEAVLIAATVSADGSVIGQQVIEQQEEFIALSSNIFEPGPNRLAVRIHYHKSLQGEKKGAEKWVTIKVED